MTTAHKIYTDQLKKELKNHKERIVWLESDTPLWSCGAPVDGHNRRNLLNQSKKFVEENKNIQKHR